MVGESREEGSERFAPTSGRTSGVAGLVVVAAVLVWWGVRPGEVAAPVAAAALVAGVVAYAALLRPRVSVEPDHLVLRNMLETVRVPLAAIDEVAVRQVLAVRAGERRYVSPAVGRKLRAVVKQPDRTNPLIAPPTPDPGGDAVGAYAEDTRPATRVDYADHVEARIRERVAEARTRLGVRRYSDEAEALARDVRREPAWPEIGALVVSLVLLVLAVVV